MADNDAQPRGHPAMDYDEHEKTYRMFLQLVRYCIACAAAVLTFLAVLFS
jgi:Bacterial aa3 type cytochrome c oxidase subunit IV